MSSNYINASEAENRQGKPRKRKKPVDLKSLRGKARPTAWLRGLISPIDFGVKIGTIGPRMEPITKPVHCNTNDEIVGAFRDGDWGRIERLSNPKLDDHWGGRKTYYYTSDGSTKNRYILVNIDIDCHAHGTRRGAAEAAEHLASDFFPGLYHEPSTHEEGRHGYFILDKGDLEASHVKAILKDLERALDGYLQAQGFDIEVCEIKGLPPVVTWGDDGRISNYTAGILAKIPRQVDRFDEWKRTTVLDQFQIRRQIAKLRSMTPKVNPTPSVASVEKITAMVESTPSRSKAAGSIGGKLIGEEELAQLVGDGRYRRVAAALMGSHVLKTSGRSVVTTEDVAAFLLLLKFFTDRMNADGTLPVKRFEALWTGLYEAGDLERAFDCHRFKKIRDYLSDLGLIGWEDSTFIVPRIDEAGRRRKGRACKWKAGQVLMDVLDWEQERSEGDEPEEHVFKEPTVVKADEGGRGEASLVGTDPEGQPPGSQEGRRGEAPFVGTDESAFPTLPDPISLTIRSLSFAANDLRVRPVESIPCKPWRLSPDEVTILIPCFEESIRLLAA